MILGYFSLTFLYSQDSQFMIYSPGLNPAIVVDTAEDDLIDLSAELLAEDIERITGYKPEVLNKPDYNHSPLIIAGTVNSEIIRYLDDLQLINPEPVSNKWEVYSHTFIHLPENGNEALVIFGSDNRGTAYGVFRLSEIIGVSPWYWWGDILPVKKDSLIIPANDIISSEPSVKYRGIFLNDEDWGLHPWASATFEPETGDIGPKTYAKIFELLLRLRANTIWPAMHNCTRAFFHVPGNIEMARKYNIVIGSSHAEPMLRNNVDEWKTDSMGEFNYRTNGERVRQYWEQRVVQSRNNEVIFTLGMRGIHDSGMEGFEDQLSKKAALEQIITDQRQILKDHFHPDVSSVPQVFIPYKEVLDIYDSGLNLPDDICIMWTDDNYGYIRRLSTPEESRRKGGSGLYYHISYWGRPHDYLWLSTTHPLLIWEELSKAWQTRTNKIWIVNVGDIKPCEYNIQLFLDMAYDMNAFTGADDVKKHLIRYHENLFGIYAEPVVAVLWDYYRLAFERRPEFMGWSRTEPSTPTQRTAYNHFYYSDEAQKRIDAYSVLENRIKEIRAKIPPEKADAFFQLVYYPVVCASCMNKKFLFADKAFYYGNFQKRLSAADYALWSCQAFKEIVKETDRYNKEIAGGKWNGMMNYAPRSLSVFQQPEIHYDTLKAGELWDCIPEGYIHKDSCLFKEDDGVQELPVFTPSGRQRQFIDVFLTAEAEVSWEVKLSDDWIIVSDRKGVLSPVAGNKEKRIWISIDWTRLGRPQKAKGNITVNAADKSITIGITVNSFSSQKTTSLAESNGLVSVYASNYSRVTGSAFMYWKKMEGLGHAGSSLVSLPYVNYASLKRESGENYPMVEYDFYTFSNSSCSVVISCLPVHPLYPGNKLRMAVSMDDSPPGIVDFATYGRSEEWKQNVLGNSAQRSVFFGNLNSGLHTLKIAALDPGIILDHIVIDLGEYVDHYGVIEETRYINSEK